MVGPISIAYRDQYVVAANKPGGMPVHRSREHARVKHVLLQTMRDQLGMRVNPVHRIDRATSGLVLLAFDGDSARLFTEALAAPDTHKEYLALVRGRFPDDAVVDRPLTNKTTGVSQEARTEFRRLAVVDLGGEFGEGSLILARIHSGRRHQIRRHTSHLRHQILVDSTYGKGAVNRHCRAALGISRMFLHALRLTLTHPVTSERLTIEAPLPADLAEPLARLLPVEQWPEGAR